MWAFPVIIIILASMIVFLGICAWAWCSGGSSTQGDTPVEIPVILMLLWDEINEKFRFK